MVSAKDRRNVSLFQQSATDSVNVGLAVKKRQEGIIQILV